MAQSQDALRYAPLPEGDSIRILRLACGAEEDELRCSLIITSLHSPAVDYEAVSYVWGEVRANNRLALVEDSGQEAGHVQLKPNLATALRHLRYADKPRYLWADAVCINQDDADERSQQVSQMASIFASAVRVLVWLGPDQKRQSEASFLAIRELAGMVKEAQLSSAKYCEDVSLFENTSEDVNNTEIRRSIVPIFGLDWFWRLWCVQELVLARDAVLLWGSEEIRWQDLSDVSAFLVANRTRLQQYESLTEMPALHHAYLLRHLQEPEDAQVPKLSLLRMLSLTRHYEVSNPIDRVFSLLGLTSYARGASNSAAAWIEVDYRKSLEEIHLEVATAIIRSDGDLLLLSSVQQGSQDGCTLGTPSWVPKWHEGYVELLTPYDFVASRRQLSERLTNNLVVDGSRLFCDGYVVDPIIGCAGVLPDREGHGYSTDTLKMSYERIKDLWSRSNNALKYSAENEAASPRHLIRAFFSTLRGQLGKEPWDSDITRQEEMAFQSWLRDGHEIYELELRQWESIVKLARTLPRTCVGRKVYCTRSGALGIGPSALQAADVVCTLRGTGAPMILRDCCSNWLLVGETYFHEGKLLIQTIAQQGRANDPSVDGLMSQEGQPAAGPPSSCLPASQASDSSSATTSLRPSAGKKMQAVDENDEMADLPMIRVSNPVLDALVSRRMGRSSREKNPTPGQNRRQSYNRLAQLSFRRKKDRTKLKESGLDLNTNGTTVYAAMACRECDVNLEAACEDADLECRRFEIH